MNQMVGSEFEQFYLDPPVHIATGDTIEIDRNNILVNGRIVSKRVLITEHTPPR